MAERCQQNGNSSSSEGAKLNATHSLSSRRQCHPLCIVCVLCPKAGSTLRRFDACNEDAFGSMGPGMVSEALDSVMSYATLRAERLNA